MNILILGASGMLGHKLMQQLGKQFDTWGTVRDSVTKYQNCLVLGTRNLLGHISVENFDSVVTAIATIQPHVVINCIGIIKQRTAAQDPQQSITINALFPHRLARLCQATGSRLIHISTDCVFSGQQGYYSEDDQPDADDLYGRTKLLGEVLGKNCLTLRTSLIGRELENGHSLLEWFLSQHLQGKMVSGYQRSIFSGFTTLAIGEIISRIITDYPHLQGLYHVAAEPISKFDLLSLINLVYNLKIEIQPEVKIKIDRSLNGAKFRQATGIVPLSWLEMITQMHQDPTPYSEIWRNYVNR